jgi:alginate O-acetyltransferase complex protein AlgI
MLLGGLWHGAAWNFVLWGAAHGSWLAAEHAVGGGAARNGWRRGLAVLVTFHFVCATWILFRAPDLERAGDFFAGFARLLPAASLATPFALSLLVLMAVGQFLPRDRVERVEAAAVRLPLWAQGALLGMVIVAVDAAGPIGIAPFIYFQF